MRPVERSREQPGAQQRIITLDLDPALFWFRGHFDVQPLLPGVAQIDWVMHYAAELPGSDWQFAGIDRVKFQRPLLPEQRVRLHLHWDESRQLLLFNYTVGEGEGAQVASQGQIKLCR